MNLEHQTHGQRTGISSKPSTICKPHAHHQRRHAHRLSNVVLGLAASAISSVYVYYHLHLCHHELLLAWTCCCLSRPFPRPPLCAPYSSALAERLLCRSPFQFAHISIVHHLYSVVLGLAVSERESVALYCRLHMCHHQGLIVEACCCFSGPFPRPPMCSPYRCVGGGGPPSSSVPVYPHVCTSSLHIAPLYD